MILNISVATNNSATIRYMAQCGMRCVWLFEFIALLLLVFNLVDMIIQFVLKL
jgi:hypothetical protein